MASPQHAANPTRNPALQELDGSAFFKQLVESQHGDDGLDRAVRMANLLQTTLDIEKIIEIFGFETQRCLAVQCIEYTLRQAELRVTFGSTLRKHRLHYRLTIGEETLGEITFSRSKKFNAADTEYLENLLCGLVYPLRNALAYYRAVQAALHDPLTGLSNRAAMDSALVREIELARRYETALSLIALDIDYFKRINDSYGHAAGDYVLKRIAGILRSTVRGSDMVFRYGGEEFMVLVSNTDRQGALFLAERIRGAVAAATMAYQDLRFNTTVSLGVACLDRDDHPESFFNRADQALYEAKASGRNQVRFHSAAQTAPPELDRALP